MTEYTPGDPASWTWPDASLEKMMIEDADLVLGDYPAADETAISNVACHVRALLQRVRDLEDKMKQLRESNKGLSEQYDGLRKLWDDACQKYAPIYDLANEIAARCVGRRIT